MGGESRKPKATSRCNFVAFLAFCRLRGLGTASLSWEARIASHDKADETRVLGFLLGLFTAALALFTELDVLLSLVSIGTLFVFYMVSNAVVYHRYVDSDGGDDGRRRGASAWPTLAFILAFSLIALSFTLLWQFAPRGGVKVGLLVACATAAVATVGAFQALVPQAHEPELWGVPGMPWVPAASVFLNVFLLGSLDRPSYVRFGFFSAATVLVYVLYSVHASYDAEESGGALDGAKVQDEGCKV